MSPESGVMRAVLLPPEPTALAAPAAGHGSAQLRAGHDYDRHLDDVVRAFFPGWGARSSRVSRPSVPVKGGQG